MSALLFDVDGTLADTEEAHRRAFNAAFHAHGLSWNWDAHLYSELLRVTGGKERLRAYLVRLDLEEDEHDDLVSRIPAIHATKTKLYTEIVSLGGLPLRAGVRRLVSEARSTGVAVGIVSTTTLENVTALLNANALNDFDVIAAGDVVPRKKPAPDIYHHALKRLRMPASAAVAIEDSDLGLRAAKSAGLFTIVTPSRWTRTQHFDGADLVLSSLGDPDEPLGPLEEQRIGAKYLRLEHIQKARS